MEEIQTAPVLPRSEGRRLDLLRNMVRHRYPDPLNHPPLLLKAPQTGLPIPTIPRLHQALVPVMVR